MTGRLEAICISEIRGVVKTPVAGATVRTDHGLLGDAHAGPWHRQVSVLSTDSIAKIKASIPDLEDGAFAENLVVSGLDLMGLVVGDGLKVGATCELEITQIGKECHNSCAIKEQTGDCVMPREGLFCRVITGGDLAVGDDVTCRVRSEARG